jgi:hypothetical protein
MQIKGYSSNGLSRRRASVLCLAILSLVLLGCNLARWIEAGLVEYATSTPGAEAPTAAVEPTVPPTSTPSPTLPPARLEGRLVEGEIADTRHQRPPLACALMVLCRKTSANVCVVDSSLSTLSDLQDSFSLAPVPPGEYIVLYNPFTIEDTASYWQYWNGRELDFTDAESLFRSFGEGSIPIYSSGETGGGVTAVNVGEEAIHQAILANKAIWYKDYPLVIEFVGDLVPVAIHISMGETVQITVTTHAAYPE